MSDTHKEGQEPIFSLPNLLTLVRLPMAVAAWFLASWPWALAALMIAAAASDMADGWFARLMRDRRRARGLPIRGLGEKGGRGAWLDPACDKAFVLSVICAVWWFYSPPWWLLLLIGTREILLVPLMLAYQLVPGMPGRDHVDLRAGIGGKLATVAQFCALWAILLESGNQLGFGMAAGFVGILAVADYVRRAAVTARDTRAS
ncbi:MAG: CDP-alcohol phosphatidyltransferase family protein [Planctomycetes bacterium]|nr:CDP-alcohol phosphatidyltransferase family protein [Planctomycetota bacterium]